MPKVYSAIARTDRYNNGAHIPDDKTKSGYRIDKSKPNSGGDSIMCLRGETYYYFTRYNCSTTYQKSYPKRSQLTGSSFLATVYDLEDGLSSMNLTSPEDVESQKEELISELDQLKDETQNSLDNMPESLQYSPSGELLQNRIDSIDSLISEIESIDSDYEEDSDLNEEENVEVLEAWLEEKSEEFGELSWDFE